MEAIFGADVRRAEAIVKMGIGDWRFDEKLMLVIGKLLNEDWNESQ